jgi:hypothetical protein
MPRIASAVKAGNHHNPMFLHLEEYSVGKAPYSGTPPLSIDDRELQSISSDGFNRGLDRQRESLPKLWADVVIPGPGIL